VRVLYVSRSSVGHDRRFVEAWRAQGFDVAQAVVEPGGQDPRRVLTDAMDRNKPDLVHVGPVTDPAWDLIHVWDGPVLVSSWGFDLMDEVEHDPERLRRARLVLARADRILVDNNAPHRRALALGADARRIVQFPWGVERSWFAHGAERPSRRDGPWTFLSTRRHEPIYRVSDVLDAFLAIAESGVDAELHIAGAGTLTGALRARAARSLAAHRVRFLGEIESASLPRAYLDADAYVTASSVDGSSVSLLEAMSCRIPVLASRIEGNAEWVSDETGFGFAAGDVAALTALMMRVVDDGLRAELARRAENAFALVLRRADWDANIRQLPEIARSACEQRWSGR
jgi:glycosyltransferase involved in cell wall biosynthesis